jgi:hypothetical protein
VVNYFLKKRVGSVRASVMRDRERHRPAVKELGARGKLTAAQVAKAEEGFRKDEEYIRTLPALIEHAKAP